MSDKFGLVSWDEEVNTGGNQNQKRDEFMRLQAGKNRLRLLTKPFQYWIHKWKEEGAKGFGDKISCSKFNGSCPLCAKGDRPKRRWYAGVVDRHDGAYKILDMGGLIYTQVQTLSRDEDWGDPGTYDINVVVDKNGGPSGYYTVNPKPKTPLSDADVELRQNADLEALKRRCAPPTPEKVQERLDKINAKNGVDTSVAASNDDDEDDDETVVFPPADAQSVA